MAGITDIVSNDRYADIMNQTATATATSKTEAEADTGLGKDAFLELLVTSMMYQDPMSPMETGEMMQQMAMLGLMEQTTNMRTALDDLANTMELSKWQQASNMLGMEVDAVNSNGEAVSGKVEEVFNYDGTMYLLTEDETFQVGQIVSLREPGDGTNDNNSARLDGEEYTVGSIE